ncbi:FliM/FliN family flagellar motor switch protein, partial [Halobacillus sp. BBL2006]|uniref:FliM/FliN family flagellar motor switch protein n=1 Tax=Halobacillus sp. BBL2006 TaxID=1543706 RepID=UPI0005432074
YEALTKTLRGAEVDIRAILGEADISIEQFLGLKQDDVIRLDQSIEKPMTLKVDNEDKFYIQPGKLKKNLAVQVLDKYQGRPYDDE